MCDRLDTSAIYGGGDAREGTGHRGSDFIRRRWGLFGVSWPLAVCVCSFKQAEPHDSHASLELPK